MPAPPCEFQVPGDKSDPVGPPQEPPGITRFSRRDLDGEGVCEGLAPVLSVAVEVAVMLALNVVVGELEPAKKVTVATYPSPVML